MTDAKEIVLKPTAIVGDCKAPYDPGSGQLLVDLVFEIDGQRYRVPFPYDALAISVKMWRAA